MHSSDHKIYLSNFSSLTKERNQGRRRERSSTSENEDSRSNCRVSQIGEIQEKDYLGQEEKEEKQIKAAARNKSVGYKK